MWYWKRFLSQEYPPPTSVQRMVCPPMRWGQQLSIHRTYAYIWWKKTTLLRAGYHSWRARILGQILCLTILQAHRLLYQRLCVVETPGHSQTLPQEINFSVVPSVSRPVTSTPGKNFLFHPNNECTQEHPESTLAGCEDEATPPPPRNINIRKTQKSS